MKIKVISFVLIVLGLIIYLSNNILQVSSYTQKSNLISQEVTILQISDLHNKQFGVNQENLLKKIDQINYDYVVLTGDLIDRTSTDYQGVIDLVTQINKPTYYITGNHEATSSLTISMLEDLEALGVTILNDQTVALDSQINITGINDPLISDNLMTIPIDQDKFNILLAHHPEQIDTYSQLGYDLVFSGHAHGGQIIIPFIGPLVAPNQGFFPKYYSGQYLVDQTTLMVSRGLGNSIFPIRLNNQPQIVKYTISPSI